MSNLLVHQNKICKLVNLLQKGVEQNKTYNLTIVSCYFNPESIKRLIDEIKNQNIQLVSLDIYVDRGDALKIGKEELLKWLLCVKQQIATQLYIFNKYYLFHPKAYCLSVHKSFYRGSLVVGSANITENGLSGQWGNLELLIDTQEPDSISKFFIDLSNLKRDFTLIEKLEEFDYIEDFEQHINDENDYLFEYYLLKCGYLVHKWDEKLSFNVFYELIKQNKSSDSEEQEIKDILGEGEREINVTKAKKSLTIRYFKKDIYKIYKLYNLNKTIRTDILGDYGVETVLGYWIPKQIVNSLKNQQKQDIFEKFHKDLIGLEEKLVEVLDLVRKDWESLKNNGKINNSSPSPVENFEENFKKIISDSKLLERIYYRYAIIELPYHISQDIEIKEMYKSLIQTCDKKHKYSKYSKENLTSRAVREANSTKDLNKIINLKVNNY
ncbi:MAG TPA: phospholipase D family protein [Leptolyngbyaceae cyanobacterium]